MVRPGFTADVAKAQQPPVPQDDPVAVIVTTLHDVLQSVSLAHRISRNGPYALACASQLTAR